MKSSDNSPNGQGNIATPPIPADVLTCGRRGVPERTKALILNALVVLVLAYGMASLIVGMLPIFKAAKLGVPLADAMLQVGVTADVWIWLLCRVGLGLASLALFVFAFLRYWRTVCGLTAIVISLEILAHGFVSPFEPPLVESLALGLLPVLAMFALGLLVMLEIWKPPAQARRRLHPWWEGMIALAIVTGVSCQAYRNSYDGTWFLDDFDSILNNICVRAVSVERQPRDFSEWVKNWIDASDSVPNTSVSGRPVTSLTLAANFRLAEFESDGKPDLRLNAEEGELTYGNKAGYNVYTYHIVNYGIHLATAFLLFGIIRRTLLTERIRKWFGRWSAWIAGIVTLLWTVHPIQTETVTYIIQRAESVMGLFFLLTMYATIRAYTTERAASRTAWQMLGIAAALMGMGAKEVMAMCPLVLIIYDWVFLSGTAKRLLQRWQYYGALLLSAGLMLYLWTTGPRDETAGFSANMLRLIPPLDYGISQPQVITEYLKLLFWPATLCLDYAWPVARLPVAPPPPWMTPDKAQELVRARTDEIEILRVVDPAAIAIVLAVVALALLIWRLAKKRARPWEPAAFFGGWLIVMLPAIMAFDRIARVVPALRQTPLLVAAIAAVAFAAVGGAMIVMLHRSGLNRWWTFVAIFAGWVILTSGVVILADTVVDFQQPSDEYVNSLLPAKFKTPEILAKPWPERLKAMESAFSVPAQELQVAQGVNDVVYNRIAWYALLVGGLFALTMFAIVTPAWRPWGFLGMWFYIILAPTSSIAPLADLLFEHRVYLPMIAVIMVVVLALYLPLRWLLPRILGPLPEPAPLDAQAPPALPKVALGPVGWVLAIIMALVPVSVATGALSVATYSRNRVYLKDASIYKDTIEKRPFNARAHSNLGYCRANESGKAGAAAAEARAKGDLAAAAAKDALSQTKLNEAISLLQRAISLDPRFHDAYHNHAVICAQLGRVDNAQMLFTHAIELYPRHFRAHNGLAALYSRLGTPGFNCTAVSLTARALERYRAAMAANPAYAADPAGPGQPPGSVKFFTDNPDIGKEAAELGKALAALDTNPMGGQQQRDFITWIFTQLQANTLVSELERYRQTIKANPTLADLSRYFTNRAMEHYSEAVRANPDYADARCNVGVMLDRLGRADEAIQSYREAIRIDPAYVDAYNNLGLAYASRGLYAAAMDTYRAALARDPRHLRTMANLATLLATCEDPNVRNGPQALTVATELNRMTGFGDPMALAILGLAQARTNDFANAAQALTKALDICAHVNAPPEVIARYRSYLQTVQAGSPVQLRAADFKP